MDDTTMHGTQKLLFKVPFILPLMLVLTSCSTTGNMQSMHGCMSPSSAIQHKHYITHKHASYQPKHTVKHTKQVVTHKSTAQHTTAPVVSKPKQAAAPAPVKPMTVKKEIAKVVAVKPVAVKPVAVKPVAVKPSVVKPTTVKLTKTMIKPITVKVVTVKPVVTTPVTNPKTPIVMPEKPKGVAVVVPTEVKHSVLLTAKSIDLNPRNYNNLGKVHDIVASLRYQDLMNGRYHTIQVVRWDGMSANETVVNARTATLEAIAGLTTLENGLINSGFGPVVVILGGNAYLMNLPGDPYDFIMIYSNKKFPQKHVKTSLKHVTPPAKLTHAFNNKYRLVTDFYITNVNGVIGIRVADKGN